MASVSFKILSKRNPCNIYCRFVNGKQIDITTSLGIFVDPKTWDNKNQKIKNVIAVKNRDLINKKLLQLKIDIIDTFNVSFMEGEIIDKDWLDDIVANFMNRPKQEKQKDNKHSLYFVDFAEWWIDNKSQTWLTSSNSYMSDRTKQQYRSFIAMVKEYQGKRKIKLNSSGYATITDFVRWMNENAYAEKTMKKRVTRFKFFFKRAKAEGFKIDPTYEQRVFIPKTEEITDIYLNESEIQKIYDIKLDNESLDNVRDNLIIACSTGLRISDFLNKLDLSNFIDDYIEIKTTKTKTPVIIPIHRKVKNILLKRNGKLPKKISDPKFNKYVKDVCKKAGLTKEIKGRKFDSATKRKVAGIYKKYELVTSHIGRKSFATNLYGKIDLHIISSILGHSTTNQTMDYIKKGNIEYAMKLKEHWESKTT